MRKKLIKIIRNYGLKNQLKKLNEEVFELIEVIIDYSYVEVYKGSPAEKYHKNHMEEEFADVMVLLSQIKHFYNLDSEKIKKIMDYKINRQLERIKRGE